MRHPLKVLTALVFIPLVSFGQKDSNKFKPSFRISINGGIAFPLGMYCATYFSPATTHITDDAINAGFASQGIVLNVRGDITLDENWSVTIMSDYIHNEFNGLDFIDGGLDESPSDLLNIIQAEYPPFKPYSAETNLSLQGKYYYTSYTILAGLTCNSTLGKKLSLGFRALAGPFFFNIPHIHSTYTGFIQDSTGATRYNFNENWDFNAAHYTKLGIDFGTSLKYQILSHLSAIVSADILLSSAPIDPTYQVTDANGKVLVTGDFNDPINITILKTTLGLEYDF